MEKNICVAISCYNQEKYIETCMRHLLQQKYSRGGVCIKICDDASTDETQSIIKNIIEEEGLPENWTVEDCSNETNMGMPLNTKRILRKLMESGADYGCILEGDDYWISPFWLEKHVKDMDEDSGIAMSNNYLLFYWQESNIFSVRQYPEYIHQSKYITASMQAEDNYTGNFSSSLYRIADMKKIPIDFLEQPYVDDWFVNLLMAQQGKIVSLKEPLSVYRIHNQGVWNGEKKNWNKMNSTILNRIHFMHQHYPGQYMDELAAFSEQWAKIPIRGKIYYDLGRGFSEENTIVVYTLFDCKAHFKARVDMPDDLGIIKKLRYDPEEGYPCTVKNLKISINGIEVRAIPENGKQEKEAIVFETSDPIFRLELLKSMKTVEKIEIEGEMIFE